MTRVRLSFRIYTFSLLFAFVLIASSAGYAQSAAFITFNWKTTGARDLGLGAEDVAAVEPLLVIHNDQGQVEGVKYDRIGVILINAIKEQQAQIEALKRLVCQSYPNAPACK